MRLTCVLVFLATGCAPEAELPGPQPVERPHDPPPPAAPPSVEEAEGVPIASVQPKLITFGASQYNKTQKRPIRVSNVGGADLMIHEATIQGHPDYWLSGGDDMPVRVEQGQFVTFVVSFDPKIDVPAVGRVTFRTNDPARETVVVEVRDHAPEPCLHVNPKKVQFGGKLVGAKAMLPVEFAACGAHDLVVTGLSFSPDSHPDFSLKHGPLPLLAPKNETGKFHVIYVPSVEVAFGEDGQPMLHTATILFESNSFISTVEIPVSALGLMECCAAVGIIVEGEQVVPGTTLHLIGGQSPLAASWKWGIQQPPGATGAFLPSDTAPNPTFETTLAGEYTFSLETWDDSGVKSMVPWKQTVHAVPDEAIRIELSWAEADVDLDLQVDPDQGAVYSGSGPEAVSIQIPQDTTYNVAVHHNGDDDSEPAFATVRIYIYSNLVFEAADWKLASDDTWTAAEIDWPSAKITAQ